MTLRSREQRLRRIAVLQRIRLMSQHTTLSKGVRGCSPTESPYELGTSCYLKIPMSKEYWYMCPKPQKLIGNTQGGAG